MGNHRRKKGPSKKPGTSQVQETPATPGNVSTVEEVQIQVEKVDVVADVKSPAVDEIVPVSCKQTMSEVESELKKLDLNAEKA